MPGEAIVNRELAQHLAKRIKETDWDLVRDLADIATDGDLDPFQLDMLTDWIVAEHKRQS
jgi:hypothetical protein